MLTQNATKVIRPLKARLGPTAEWIQNTADIGSHAYGAALIVGMISKNLK